MCPSLEDILTSLETFSEEQLPVFDLAFHALAILTTQVETLQAQVARLERSTPDMNVGATEGVGTGPTTGGMGVSTTGPMSSGDAAKTPSWFRTSGDKDDGTSKPNGMTPLRNSDIITRL